MAAAGPWLRRVRGSSDRLKDGHGGEEDARRESSQRMTHDDLLLENGAQGTAEAERERDAEAP